MEIWNMILMLMICGFKKHKKYKRDNFFVFNKEIKLNMEIALQRIQDCINGVLDLSNLDLTEIPLLPSSLIELRCGTNRLTFLPELPPSLLRLYCSSNQLTFLPHLPSSLITLTCQFNQLKTLPPLPTTLTMILCDVNQLTTLPELPTQLTYLSCSMNQLTSLPTLSQGLEKLYCSDNLLQILPDLPLTLTGLACELPHTNHIFASNELTPDQIVQLNQENKEWMEYQSKVRCVERCSIYFLELMHNRWHPDRVFHLRKIGYMPKDMY